MLSKQLGQHIGTKSVISIIALFAFITCFILSDVRAAVDVGNIPYKTLLKEPVRFARLDVDTFTIPAHLGEIEYTFKGTSNKFVIHLQDAHCNRFAQHKISGIIDYLNKEYGIRVINLEGGVGNYDLTVFTSITGEAIRREVADYFVKKGEINGAEFYAINNPEKVILWGIEDRDLYLANLKVYRDSLGYKEEVDKFLKELTHILNNLKRHIYSPSLLKIDMAYNAYKAGNMELREYLEFLIARAKERGIPVRQFANLYLLVQAMGLEDEIDFKKANMERNILIEGLKKGLSRNEIRELVSKSVDFKTKRISRKVFYDYLLKKARELGLNINRFPALSNYIVYVSLYEAVDRSKVMEEMDGFEAEIKEQLYRNDTQRQLNRLSRNLALMKNIFAITLTKTDYRYYLENKSSFDISNYLRFIMREAPRYKISARPNEEIAKLDDYREEISKFYEYSFKRDEVFLENLRFSQVGEGTESAILMTGGFHTENLCGLFKKAGISYVSIMPKFSNAENYESPYFDILAGQTTNIQRMLSSVLARGAMLQIASKLSTLGRDVWGEDGITVFEAAVRVHTNMVRLAWREENGKLVSTGERIIAMYGGEEIYAEGKGKDRRIQLEELLRIPASVAMADMKERKSLAGLISLSSKLLTHNAAVPTAFSEKYALHKAMEQIGKGKRIVVVTAEPSALSELNARWGHTSVDVVRDSFGRASYELMEKAGDELAGMGVEIVAYYNPYGGRWHYVFAVDKKYDQAKFANFLENMVRKAIKEAQAEAVKQKLDTPEAFNVVMGVSAPWAASEGSQEFLDIVRRKLADALYHVRRRIRRAEVRRPDMEEKIESWIALTEKSPPAEVVEQIARSDYMLREYFGRYLGISPTAEGFLQEFLKALEFSASGEYYKRVTGRAVFDSHDLVVYAENKYYVDRYIPWASRSIRGDSPRNSIFAHPQSSPADLAKVFFHGPAIDKWLGEARRRQKERFKYMGLPPHIPDFARLEKEGEALQKELKSAGRVSEDLRRRVEDFISEVLALRLESETGVLQGVNVLNTLTRRFLETGVDRAGGLIFRINIDFDYLSRAPVKAGDVIKNKGMPIIRNIFEEEFTREGFPATVAMVQKGAGDESVVVGYFDGEEEALQKIIKRAIRRINRRLKQIKFNGKPITYDIGEGQMWRPSISAGEAVMQISEGMELEEALAAAETLDSKAEIANKYSKEQGRQRVTAYTEDIQRQMGEEVEREKLEPIIPPNLLPYALNLSILSPYLEAGMLQAGYNRFAFHKYPGTAAPEYTYADLRNMRRKIPSKNVTAVGKDTLAHVNKLLLPMIDMAKAEGLIDKDADTAQITEVEIATLDLGDRAESLSYVEEDGKLVVMLNSREGRSNDYFVNEEAMAHMIRHEFLEANRFMEHGQLKYLEMLENEGNALTPLNRMALRHMTIDQLGMIKEDHRADPGGVFYRAARAEIEGRYARDLLSVARPGIPCAILLPLTEGQMLKERGAFQAVGVGARRILQRKYGANIRVLYYLRGDAESLARAREKAVEDRDFARDERSLLLAFVSTDMPEDAVERFMRQKRVAGVVREELEEDQRVDEVLHVVLGIGLIDYVRDPERTDLLRSIKELLSVMVEDPDSLKGMDMEKLLKGLVLLKIKRIDYGEIDDWKKAQDETLRAL